MRGVADGDVLLRVAVTPHALFKREDDNLTVGVPVDLYTALLGGEVQVPTLERPVALKIPAGTQNGKTFRLRGLGMPHLRNPDQRGDLLAVVDVRLPARLSERERQLFEELRQLRS
jgi:DnaJ-class molecular chaperone